MKAVYAHYSKPYGSDIRNSQGKSHWLFPYMEFMILAYSAAKSKEFFGHTTLVTDEYGKKLIIDDLGIPFDEVIVELDNCETKPRFWASGKIYGYTKAIKKFEPFVFFDNDAGFHRRPQPFNGGLVTQNIEHYDYTTFGLKFKDMLNRLVKETPNEFPYDIYHEAHKGGLMKGCNCGVMYFENEAVWSEFSRYVWALQNSSFFDKVETEAKAPMYRHFTFWNVIVEQCLIYNIYKRLTGEEPGKLFDFNGFDFPAGTQLNGYFHIWGWKRNREKLKERERLALDYLPKNLTNRIYQYFNRIPLK